MSIPPAHLVWQQCTPYLCIHGHVSRRKVNGEELEREAGDSRKLEVWKLM
jgi:hypothetical protein